MGSLHNNISQMDTYISKALVDMGPQLPTINMVRETIALMLARTEMWIENMLGRAVAEMTIEAMIAACNKMLFDPFEVIERDKDWTGAMSERTRLYSAMERLLQYAEEGVIRDTTSDEASEEAEKEMEYCNRILPGLPVEWLSDVGDEFSYNGFWLIFGKARARNRLEREMPLSIDDVALLAGIAQKSARNATQEKHGDKKLVVNESGVIDFEDAIRWLADRKGFTPSLSKKGVSKIDKINDASDYVFVPVGKDGTEFLPNSCRSVVPSTTIYHVCLDRNEEESYGYMETLESFRTANTISWYDRTKQDWINGVLWKRYSKYELRRLELDLLDVEIARMNKMEKEWFEEQEKSGDI